MRAGGNFPSHQELTAAVLQAAPEGMVEGPEEATNGAGYAEIGAGRGGSGSGVGGSGSGEGKTSQQQDDANVIHMVMLPSGESVGLCRPAVHLSQWFFTLQDQASRGELEMITPQYLVDNLGAQLM